MEELKPRLHRYFKLIDGFSHNPLLRYGRNDPCICGSNKKFKKCCLPKLPRGVPSPIADDMKNKSVGTQAAILLEYIKEQQKHKDSNNEDIKEQ